jgi:hypothetical protein
MSVVGRVLLDVAYGLAGAVNKLANECCEGGAWDGARQWFVAKDRDNNNAGERSTCEELDLFGWPALVERVGPALRLSLHHGVVIVPATTSHDNAMQQMGASQFEE